MEAWLSEQGAVGLHDLAVADFPLTGRGVAAQRAFKEGERILTIPAACLWTVEHARADPLLGPVLRSVQPSLSVEDTLALHILLVRSRPDDPKYKDLQTHVARLPESYSHSIFFTDEELDVCEGSSLHALTTQLRGRVGDDYKQLLVRVFMRHRDLFPLDKFGIQDYKWALATIWSRGMDFTLSEGTSLRLLAPFADMLNHSSDVKQCHAYDPSTGDLSILASKDYTAGEQVFIYYGPVPNNRLLRLYGFVLPDNPHDSYDLVLHTSPTAPLYESKEKLWKFAGLDAACTVALTARDPLPRSLLRYLRIQRLNESEIAAMTMQIVSGVDEKVSNQTEILILQFLIDSIADILENFAIPLETLTAQLADGTYLRGSNAWAAAQVSAGEQRVLRLAKAKAESLMPRENQCARCGKDSAAAALMTCGRCKSAQYCGRECQVAHFGEHKATCRVLANKMKQEKGV